MRTVLYAAAGAKFAFDTATLQNVVQLVVSKIEELEQEAEQIDHAAIEVSELVKED